MKSTSRWRVKGKLKIILILLCLFSALFISYQILYYTTLTQYQFDQSHDKILNSESNRKPVIIASSNNKGQPEPLVEKQKPISVVGKPIFSGSILGVAPEYWHLYTKQQLRNRHFFTCLTTERKISWSRVNDDYCDCVQDGSDEPATAACMNGRFFCSQTGKKFPDYIPSSRVNDGIRDCIDGSDEFKP